MRVVAVADFANGVSSVLDMARWSYLNADLTVWCYRQPAGEWIALDSQMALSGHGVGCSHSSLFDAEGRLGWAAQSLLVDARSQGPSGHSSAPR
jgi:hypothetical protein